jgi:hypothetical protein
VLPGCRDDHALDVSWLTGIIPVRCINRTGMRIGGDMETVIDNLIEAADKVAGTDGVKLSRAGVLLWWVEDGLITEAEYRAVEARLSVVAA